ncbi:thrombospondin [Micromonospora sp. NBC_01412]|uniref:thrombospondin n=1 Tax=Micromonospora sp. NBC_01412 TaxID=2903590 RepID=UPI003245F7C3
MKIPSLLSRRNEPATTNDSNGDGRVDGFERAVATDTGSRPDGRPVLTDRGDEQTTYRSSTTASDGERASDADRQAAEQGARARAATARAATARTPDGEAQRPTTGPSTAPAEPTTTGSPTTEPTLDLDRDRTAGRPLPADPTIGRPAGRGRTAERPAPVDRTGADGETRPEPVALGPRPRASLLATLGLIVGVAGALAVLTGTLAGYGIAVGVLGAVLSVFGLLATRRRHIAGKTDALLGMAFGIAAVVLGVLAMTGQFDWPTTDGDWVQRLREWLDSQFVDRF